MPDPVVQTPDPVADYLARYGPKPQTPVAAPATAPADDPVAHYLATYGGPPAPAPKPGVLSRAGNMILNVAAHPIDAAESAIVAPLKSAFTAVVAPGVGEARPDARLSKGGNSSGRPIDTT